MNSRNVFLTVLEPEISKICIAAGPMADETSFSHRQCLLFPDQEGTMGSAVLPWRALTRLWGQNPYSPSTAQCTLFLILLHWELGSTHEIQGDTSIQTTACIQTYVIQCFLLMSYRTPQNKLLFLFSQSYTPACHYYHQARFFILIL